MLAPAAVLYESKTPLRIEDVEVLPPQRGEVTVRMKAAGVCHSDLHVMKGDLTMPTPIILGHEGSGVIEAVGEGVTTVQVAEAAAAVGRLAESTPGRIITTGSTYDNRANPTLKAGIALWREP
jgi:S-(hydroxymethyl)glutathione dehydrogenase/alcohol dehydrogenase